MLKITILSMYVHTICFPYSRQKNSSSSSWNRFLDYLQREHSYSYLTWRDMSSQQGILNVFSSNKLWTAPSKDQYLPS